MHAGMGLDVVRGSGTDVVRCWSAGVNDSAFSGSPCALMGKAKIFGQLESGTGDPPEVVLVEAGPIGDPRYLHALLSNILGCSYEATARRQIG